MSLALRHHRNCQTPWKVHYYWTKETHPLFPAWDMGHFTSSCEPVLCKTPIWVRSEPQMIFLLRGQEVMVSVFNCSSKTMFVDATESINWVKRMKKPNHITTMYCNRSSSLLRLLSGRTASARRPSLSLWELPFKQICWHTLNNLSEDPWLWFNLWRKFLEGTSPEQEALIDFLRKRLERRESKETKEGRLCGKHWRSGNKTGRAKEAILGHCSFKESSVCAGKLLY